MASPAKTERRLWSAEHADGSVGGAADGGAVGGSESRRTDASPGFPFETWAKPPSRVTPSWHRRKVGF